MNRIRSLTLFVLLVVSLAGLGGAAPEAAAADRFAVNAASAAWNLTSTWSATSGGAAGASIPVAGDNVFIGETATARAVTIPAGYTAQATNVTLGTTAGVANAKTLTLSASDSTLTVSGNLTVNKPSNAVNNLLNVNAGTVNVGGTLTLGGTTGTATRVARIVITTGTLNIDGNLVFVAGVAANNSINFSASSGTINLKGAFTATVGTIQNPGTSVFNYKGTAAQQTALIGVSSIIYQNLHFNNTFNSGTPATSGVILSAAISAANVLGNVRVQAGNLNNGGFAIVGGAGDTFQVADGARFNLTGTTSVMPTGFSTTTLGTAVGNMSTVSFQGTGIQVIASGPTYGHLIAAGGNEKRPAAGTLTVAGDLTVSAGSTFNANTSDPVVNVTGNVTVDGTYTASATPASALTIGGNLSGTGTYTGNAAPVNLAGNFTRPTTAFTSGAGLFTLNGTAAAAQTISGPPATTTTFTNLRINNTGAPGGVTMSTDVTVDTQLTLSSGTFAVGANLLRLNGPSIAGTPANLSTSASSSLYFGGASAGVIVPSGVTQLDNLTVDNANGITLGSSPTVNGLLTFTNGDLVTTSAHTLTMGSAAPPIAGAGTTRHVVGNLARAFLAVAGTSYIFTLGDGTNYTPVTITFPAAPTAGTLTISTSSATALDHPDTTSVTSSLNSAKSVNRYWTMKKDAALAGAFNAAFTYVAGDVDDAPNAHLMRFARGSVCTGSGSSRSCSTTWTNPTTVASPTSTLATATGITLTTTSESDFAIGELGTTRFAREREFIYTRERY